MSVFRGGPAPVPDHPGYVSGVRYGVAKGISVTTAAIAANTLYATPWLIGAAVTIAALKCRFATGAVGAGKMGIYANARGNPGALVAECSTAVDTALTTTQSTGFAANPTLLPGWYWFCLCCNSTPSPMTAPLNNQTGFSNEIGGTTDGAAAMIAATLAQRLTGPLTYAGPGAFFPATFPAITRGTGTPGSVLFEFEVA